MEAKEFQKIFIGTMLVSDPVHSARYMFPASSIIPGTEAFEIFERLESILQNSSKEYSLRDQLSFALSKDILSNIEELKIYAEQTASGVWKILTIVDNDPVVLLKLGEEPTRQLPQKVEMEIVPTPKEEIIPSAKESNEEPYHLILSTNEWQSLTTPYSNKKAQDTKLRKTMFKRPLFLQQEELGNSSHVAILALVAISAFIIYLGLSL